MKTVTCKIMSAVNEFKGVWPFSDSIVMYYTAGTDGYGFYSHINKGLDATGFTSEKFNDLVSQLETNFGECDPVLAAYYRHVTDKELLTKSTKELEVMDNYSKAIEKIKSTAGMHGEVSKYGGNLMYNKVNADIYWVSDDDGSTSYARWSDNGSCFNMFEWRNNGLKGLDLEIIKYDEYKSQAQPVFTQSMADNGDIPDIGVECDLYLNKECVSALGHIELRNESMFVFKYKENGLCDIYDFGDNAKFKPIDTRTNKEKAFDEHFDKSGCDYKYQSILRNAFDAGVKWVGE
ncbi:MAG TPA: hypothetical protein EYN54_09245 [Methylococcaceae bacterium]|nr:hypothetical protein [Methylococcaceae bacterium]